ncbi:helix-turn-helix domain-containing protein [Microbacterium sp. XT11]|uniref:helix-turn-helix domain-containing protein n=1 Tax=Microbacterium sp. XT11 TaxID=367477 RepID=UPI001E29A17B|nr:helix-turn-helix domain-containing protein [Microbacterium sp. XT11]
MHRADFELRDGNVWMRNEELASFLRFSNLQVVSVDPARPLRARFALFPHESFGHVSAPRTTALWPRDENSVDRVLALITRAGSLEIETEGVVYRRPGVALVCPGDSSVTMSLTGDDNEVLYISASPALLDGVVLPSASGWNPEPPQPELLMPSVLFMAGLCRISTNTPHDAAPLRMAAREVARSVVMQIVGDASEHHGLFSRAMQVIVADHADPELAVKTLAARMGVSTRTLQLAFSNEGTTAGAQLRDVRARAALRLRSNNPAMTHSAVARAVGFGSVSAMHRALARVDETGV